MKTTVNCFAAVAIMLMGSTPAHATVIVSSGNFNVAAGTPVTVPLLVSNGSAAALSDIEGLALTFQISAGTGTAPRITSVDLLTGTIWSGHVSAANISIPTGGNTPQYQSRDLLTDAAGDFVNANGLLATVSIDTTGALPGDYAIKLVGTKTAGRDSTLLNGVGEVVSATFGDGKITVAVPEPNSSLLGMFGMSVIATVSFWKRRRTGVRTC